MINRDEILAYVRQKYGTQPDHPWLNHPDYAVLRHEGSGKWYGVIMNVPNAKLGLLGEGDAKVLNLKCDPVTNSLLRGQHGILPAYHMNKEHWITVVLDSPFPKEEVYNLIDMSFRLTKRS